MHEDYSTIAQAQVRRNGRVGPLLGIAGTAFVLGAALVAAVWWSGFAPGELIGLKTVPAAAPSAAPSALPSEASAAQASQAVAQVQQVVQQQGGLDSRVAAMEQRLSKLDLQLQASSGNASRAEGLLVAFAARQAIERGEPLGYLTDQLQLRFGEAHPDAVRTVVEFSRDPVTLDQLAVRLQGMSPTLVKAPKDEGALSWIGREISGLFVIRRESTPSPEPQQRLDRAQLFLEGGRIEPATMEVGNMPNAPAAADWIADAKRYEAARDALDMLEKSALIDSRGLRDGAGRPVEQPSPVAN